MSRGMNSCLNNSLKFYIIQFLRKTPLMRKSTEFFRNILESKEKIAKKSDGEETSLQTAETETKEPCEAAANEKPGERLMITSRLLKSWQQA